MRIRAALRWGLRIGVSAGIVSYILVDVDRRDLLHALISVQPSLLVAPMLLYLAGQVLSGVKWWMIGTAVGLDRPLLEYLRFYFVGMSLNVFGLSTIGGDVVRALYLGDGRRPVLALNSVVFDRFTGLAMLMAMAAVALLATRGWDFPWWFAGAVTGGGLALVVGWWMCPLLVRLLPARNRIRHQVEHDLAPFWRDPWLLLRVAVVSLCFHLSQVGVQWLLARAAGAGNVPLAYWLVAHPILSIMMALPVSIGGFGVREGGYIYFLTRIDVDDSVAVTMGLLWFLTTAVSGIVGGLVFLASGAELPRLRAPRRHAEPERGAA